MDCHNYYGLSITVCSIRHWKSTHLNVWRGISNRLEGKVLASFPQSDAPLKRLITNVSRLSQKPGMSSAIYMFVLDFVNNKIQGFTLNTEPWDSSHWKMLAKEGGGERGFLSHCSRESNTGAMQQITQQGNTDITKAYHHLFFNITTFLIFFNIPTLF